MKPSEILRRAKSLVDTPEKWGKGQEDMCNGRICAGIAIEEASNGLWIESKEIFRAANGLLKQPLIFLWNDHADRVFADIAPAFDRAIAEAERREAMA